MEDRDTVYSKGIMGYLLSLELGMGNDESKGLKNCVWRWPFVWFHGGAAWTNSCLVSDVLKGELALQPDNTFCDGLL
jgi:hypothetical protein